MKFLHLFRGKKRCLYVLNTSLELKQKKETAEKKQNKKCQQLTKYFLALTSCPTIIKIGRRIEEWGRIHNTWIINRFFKYCIWQQQYWQGGVKGHLRRISETGKVTNRPWSRAKHLREVTRYINRRVHDTAPLKNEGQSCFSDCMELKNKKVSLSKMWSQSELW